MSANDSPTAHPDVVVLGQQLQQLEAGEIGVVEAGVDNEVGIDARHTRDDTPAIPAFPRE